MAIVFGVLFPDESIGCDGKKTVPIFRYERPKLDQFAFQMWLKIKRHSNNEQTLLCTLRRGKRE
jgi:hypothetical protein